MFTTTVPMATKLYSLVIYLKGLLSYSNMTFNQVALLDHVAIWKTLLLLLQDLWLLNLAVSWLRGLAYILFFSSFVVLLFDELAKVFVYKLWLITHGACDQYWTCFPELTGIVFLQFFSYCYLRRVWCMTTHVLFRKNRNVEIKWVCGSF